jgi:hypothetical protein
MDPNVFLKDFERRLRTLSDPPIIVGATRLGLAGDVVLKFQHAGVLWHLVGERGAISLVASPSFSPDDWFDDDLLSRLISGKPARPPGTQISDVEDPLSSFETLRAFVGAAFSPGRWAETRKQLMAIGYRRDAERFGRPIPPGLG